MDTRHIIGPLRRFRESLVEERAAAIPHINHDRSLRLTTGIRTCIAQHGELLQGQLQDHERRYRRFLISLPCDRLYSTVTFVPHISADLTVVPLHKTKVQKVVKLVLEHFGLPALGGVISVDSNIAEGKGYGSSTADCVAGALAAADAVASTLSDENVAELVVRAENASDALMFRRVALFAHREGVALADLGPRLPRLEILGIDTDVDGVVRTLEYPPAVYDRHQIQHFRVLVAAAARAIQCGDVALLGRVATASAIINQQFLPKQMFSEIYDVAECAHALGVAVAHSGTVMSMIFDPSDPRVNANVRQARVDLKTIGISRVLRFRT